MLAEPQPHTSRTLAAPQLSHQQPHTHTAAALQHNTWHTTHPPHGTGILRRLNPHAQQCTLSLPQPHSHAQVHLCRTSALRQHTSINPGQLAPNTRKPLNSPQPTRTAPQSVYAQPLGLRTPPLTNNHVPGGARWCISWGVQTISINLLGSPIACKRLRRR